MNITELEHSLRQLRLGGMAEGLGFQSIWGVEHHFTSYTMCPDVLQMLTYFAAKSDTLLLGSIVVVLPWHNPMRVAEEVCMLDNLSNGRVAVSFASGWHPDDFVLYPSPYAERNAVASAVSVAGLKRTKNCVWKIRVTRTTDPSGVTKLPVQTL